MPFSTKIVVTPEVQGSHGTPVNTSEIAHLVAEYLTAVRADLRLVQSPRAQHLSVMNQPLVDQVIRTLENEEPWTLKIEAARIPGNSHHLAGDVRAFEVTDWNSLHVVVQPNGTESRRRGFLCLPKSVVKGSGSILNALLYLLAADVSYVRLGPMTSQLQERGMERLSGDQGEEAIRRLLVSRGEFSKQLSNTLKHRNAKTSLLERFLEAAGGVSVEVPILSVEQAKEVAFNWVVAQRLKTDRLGREEVSGSALLGAVMIVELLEEQADGRFGLGEYGYFLRELLLDELRRKERQRIQDRKTQLGREIPKLKTKIEELKRELEKAEASLREKEVEHSSI